MFFKLLLFGWLALVVGFFLSWPLEMCLFLATVFYAEIREPAPVRHLRLSPFGDASYKLLKDINIYA